MAAVAVQNPVDVKPRKTTSSSNQFADWVIPEVIEERRKRSDGKIVCNRYVTGKLLGKVKPPFMIALCCVLLVSCLNRVALLKFLLVLCFLASTNMP